MSFLEHLEKKVRAGKIPPSLSQVLQDFLPTYLCAVHQTDGDEKEAEERLIRFVEFLEKQLKKPHSFPLYHQALREPIDYRAFGLDFFRPLIDFTRSSLHGKEQIRKMEIELSQRENVIWFANHQTEPDPQAVALLLEQTSPKISEEMIFVAGHRVTTDPLAVPFSLGCNLLCIFSKKHIDHPPEKREEKILHNRKTMLEMGRLLQEGGVCIYVAPSGGRDRPNEGGEVEVAPFDPQSIEMFRLMGEQTTRKTHFYPLALATFSLLPPPQSVEKEIGEKREASRSPIHLAFGEEIDWNALPSARIPDKKERRQKQAEEIWQQVVEMYRKLAS